MSGRIDCVDYYDYTHNIGRFESLREFALLKMTYYGMAMSTPEVNVNATPNEFKIDEGNTNKIREYAVSHLEQLEEISEMLHQKKDAFCNCWTGVVMKDWTDYALMRSVDVATELVKNAPEEATDCIQVFFNSPNVSDECPMIILNRNKQD